MKVAFRYTVVAMVLFAAGLTGMVSQYVPESSVTVQAQWPNPNEPPAPNSCTWDYNQRMNEIERELADCNRYCIADEYASCFTMCLDDANAAKRQAGDDLRDCRRTGR